MHWFLPLPWHHGRTSGSLSFNRNNSYTTAFLTEEKLQKIQVQFFWNKYQHLHGYVKPIRLLVCSRIIKAHLTGYHIRWSKKKLMVDIYVLQEDEIHSKCWNLVVAFHVFSNRSRRHLQNVIRTSEKRVDVWELSLSSSFMDPYVV